MIAGSIAAVLVYLIITICHQSHANEVNQKPWLDGDKDVDLSPGSTEIDYGGLSMQNTDLPTRKRGRSTNSFYDAVIKARQNRILNEGISPEQSRTEISLKHELTKLKRRPRWTKCYSCSTSTYSSFSPPYYTSSTDVTNYAASQVHYLQRTVGRMTATIRKMNLKVTKFERWKTDSDERMASIERLINDLKLQNRETRSSLPRRGHEVGYINIHTPEVRKRDPGVEMHETLPPNRAEFEFLAQQTQVNAEMIANITKNMKIRAITKKRQIVPIAKDRSQASRDVDHEDASRHSWNVGEPSDYSNLKNAVMKMNKTLFKQDRMVNTLYTRVGRMQRCCGMNKLLAKRIGIHEKRIKEVQSKSTIALNSARLENRRVDAMDSKLENQRRTIRTLQDEMQKYDSITSKSNQRIIETVENNLKTMNDSINQLYEGGSSSKIGSIEERLFQNEETIGSFGIILGQQMDQIGSTASRIDGLERTQEDNLEYLRTNWTILNKRITHRDSKLDQLINVVNDINTKYINTEENIEASNRKISKLESSIDETIARSVETLHTNITDMEATSQDIKRQLRGLRSEVGTIQTTNKIAVDNVQNMNSRIYEHDARLEMVISQCRREIENKVSESKNRILLQYNATSTRLNAVDASVEAFESHQNLLAGENEKLKSEIQEVNKVILGLENVQGGISSSIRALVDETERKDSIFRDLVEQNTNDVRQFTNNLIANISDSITSLQDQSTARLIKIENMEQLIVRNKMKLMGLNESLTAIKTTDLTQIHAKITTLDSIAEVQSHRLRQQQTDWKEITLAVASNKIGLEGMSNTTERISTTLQNSVKSQNKQHDDITVRINRMHNGLTGKTTDIENKMLNWIGEAEARILGLETINSSLHIEVERCLEEMSAVKGGMRSLQEAEDAVFDAISSYQNTMSKQDYVERNLTILSQKVRQTLQGQGLALKSIQEIMYKLNQSLVDSQKNIEQSYSEQLQTQDQDIRSMRGLMQNFSSLITGVLNDQLAHDINQATLSTRQKSLAEKFNSQSTYVNELIATSKTTNRDIEMVKSSLTVNSEKLQTAISQIENHEDKIRMMDVKVEKLFETTLRINSTHTKSSFGIKASMKQLQNRMIETVEQLNKIEKTGMINHRTQSEIINSISSTLEEVRTEVESNENLIQQNAGMKMDIVSLMASQKMTTSLIRRTEQLESNDRATDIALTTIRREIEKQILAISKINLKNINETGYKVKKLDHKIHRMLEGLNSVRGDNKMTIENLKNISILVHEFLAWKDRADEVMGKVQEQDPTINHLNQTILYTMKLLEEQKEISDSHTDMIEVLHKNNSDLSLSIQTIGENAREYESRILITAEHSKKLDDKIINLELTRHTDEQNLDDILKKIANIEKNVSSIKDEIWYLTSDVDLNYNSTQQIFNQLYTYDEQINVINTETNALLSSLTASIASLEISLQDINGTLTYDFDDMKLLVDDFQDAFDTSNRQLARFGNSVRVMKTNTSNQFNHFSTSIDYLTQIVRESNEAVDENRDRLEALNETMLFLRLSIPALLATGVDEGLFEVKNSAKEGTLFSLNDLATRSLKGNIPRRRSGLRDGSDDAFLSAVSEGKDRKRSGFNMEAVLNGDADEMRVNSRVEAWMAGESDGFDSGNSDFGEDVDNFEDFDYETLERRKRVAKDTRRMENNMLKLVKTIKSAASNNEKVSPTFAEIENTEAVAFSAGLTQTHICCGIVKFNREFSNTGSKYNIETGRFTASKDGHYAFFVAVSERNSYVNAAIVMNGKPQISLRMDHRARFYAESQSTNTVILPLTSGDQVWIETFAGSLPGYQYPVVTFSGFLVAQ